jgi:hypothetical protein
MQSILKAPYGLLLFALLLSGVELFIWYYLRQAGYLQTLISSDQSHVSVLIIAIYILATFHFLYACFSTSRQLVETGKMPAVSGLGPELKRFYNQIGSSRGAEHLNTLLEVLDTRLRSRYAFGFIVADLMLKLGILGTVIGFIMMLGSLSNLNSVDITVMQTLLAEMSGGMKVALFTTLAGMLSGILLNIKYNLVDWAVDHLVNDIRESVILGADSKHD